MLDPLDHAPDQRDVAVQMPRRMADDGVKLRARPGIGRKIPPDADHGVAVDGPNILGLEDRPASWAATFGRPRHRDRKALSV